MDIETAIFKSLLTDQEYTRKVLPYVVEDFFGQNKHKILFNEIKKFVEKYNNLPTVETLQINISETKGSETDIKDTELYLHALDDNIANSGLNDHKWILDKTEEFCKEKALYNAILDAVGIIKGDTKDKRGKGAIPSILSDALAISFDNHIGHDYNEGEDARFEYYHKKDKHLPFDIDLLNKITNGGVIEKTLNMLMGSTGIGKTLWMCHFAAAYISQGFDVLYITLEMSEEEIAKRIDANLLGINLDDLVELPKDVYKKRINKVKQKTTGKLIVKEYPTGGASVIHFKALLNELFLKKNFKPKVIMVDYLNICQSSRKKGSEDSYGYVKSIAEELRGLAVEYNVAMWTATQTNRGGYDNSDPGMKETSDSIGVPMTVDFMAAIVSNDELVQLGQYLLIQLKNRYRDKDQDRKIIIGVDKAKQKLFNAEKSAQDNLTEDIPIMDKGPFAQKQKQDFSKFKFNS